MKTRIATLIGLIVLIASACAPVTAPAMPTPPPILTGEPSVPVTGTATVQSVEIQILQNSPLQVNAIVRGQLPDAGCTTISSIDQVREGNTFRITLMTTTDPVALCAQALTPFEHAVVLDVSNLLPGQYLVNANGVEQDFELLPRDASEFRQLLVNALSARDYELLKLMMDEPFMIAYWRSEGTTNTQEAAIEQLKLNLLPAATPITADPNKDLAALLGVDPVTIVGPEVVAASPLFVSGWGPEGKDEAILFVAQLPDGAWYWYGLLFAKDGFEEPDPIIIQPVDMNAYATNVKYVMAQQDVRMRSGPGTQFSIIGFIAAGQTAKVTGVSADGNWWRVICPDNSIGSCWVSAARHLTRPTDGIVNNPPPIVTADADVHSVEIQVLQSQPPRVNAIARGQLPDSGCTTISSVKQVRKGNTFRVTLKTKTDPGILCAQVLTPFDYTVPLEVGSLPPGQYIVRVNGVEGSFELPAPIISGTADVHSLEIQILESYPLQVNAIARGQLPDSGCTTISGASQKRSGNTFSVTLTTQTDPQAFCAQALTPFDYTIPLEVGSLLPARYIVNVNGVEESFELPEAVFPADVDYVMAQQDVPMYSGPGNQYSLISTIAAGQTARVTGVNANGSWWRVICPDNSAGSCWVSADPAYTQPTHLPS
ncbi:MAG TPA: SH3 domain-containing protein [Anaerolineales bacterium]|nr:SH3 domain-containing protein [Anaerolineales bacterium]